MKTIVIFTGFEDLPAFYVVDGDQSRFDGKVLGSDNITRGQEEDINSLLVDEEGNPLKAFSKFPVEFVLGMPDVKIISIGIIL